MSLGPSYYMMDKLFKCVFNNSAFAAVTTSYLQLHLLDPGPNGTASVVTGASGSDRKAVGFGTPTGTGTATITIANNAQVQWTNLTTGQDAQYYSLWDAVTAGNFLGSGIVNANAWAAGDTLTFAVGAISLSFNVAGP